MKFEPVRLFLMNGVSDNMSWSQGSRWSPLEKGFQDLLSDYLAGSRNSSLLCELFRAWLPQVGRPEVRFEHVVDGRITTIIAKSADEIDRLIGDGKTAADLLRVFGAVAYPQP